MQTAGDEFLWADVAGGRQILLSSLAIENSNKGKWQPIRIDSAGRGWRLGTAAFDDIEDAKRFVQGLALRESCGTPLMDIAPRVDGAYLLGVLVLSGIVAAVLPGVLAVVIVDILWLAIWIESIRDVA